MLKYKISDLAILFAGITISLLLGEMILGNLVSFYSVRFAQVYIILNFFLFGSNLVKFRPLENTLLIALLCIGFLLPAIFYIREDIIFSEIATLVWWVTFVYLLSGHIKTSRDFLLFRKTLFICSIILGLGATFVGYYKFYLFANGIIPEWAKIIHPIFGPAVLPGTSLNFDYNVFSFGILCCVAAILSMKSELKGIFRNILVPVSVFLLLGATMLSSSRRGLVLGAIVLLGLLLYNLPSLKAIGRTVIRAKVPRTPWFLLIFGCAIFAGYNLVDLKSLGKHASTFAVFKRLESVTRITSKKENNRAVRWQYCFEYFNELPIERKIFGDGFKYLRTIGRTFREAEIDHPHNIWIASLLYGGILGFLITTAFTIFTGIKYVMKFEFLGVIFFWFLLLVMLSMTSSNSIFSSRLFIVLLMLPHIPFKVLSKKPVTASAA